MIGAILHHSLAGDMSGLPAFRACRTFFIDQPRKQESRASWISAIGFCLTGELDSLGTEHREFFVAEQLHGEFWREDITAAPGRV